ncbi:hypothetical protein DPMN_000757 [Dreissena polymorpha]|uniref:Uncharacterized protein n=1 Tax=Dreissena polymorpha TaxID=45954 RepID=A0A9D4MGG6_DREPO|nr:hypothetical protein DPMN_000757 [Dreissena polymorpha]
MWKRFLRVYRQNEVPAALDKMLLFKTNVTAFPMFKPFHGLLDEKTSNSTV